MNNCYTLSGFLAAFCRVNQRIELRALCKNESLFKGSSKEVINSQYADYIVSRLSPIYDRERGQVLVIEIYESFADV